MLYQTNPVSCVSPKAKRDEIKEIKKQRTIDSLFNAGDSLLTLLKWNDAKIPYNAVLKLDPNSIKAKNKLSAIAGLKTEEDNRKKELATFWKNKTAGNNLALKNKKYKELSQKPKTLR